MDISKTSLRSLKFRYGKSDGKDREAEGELQRRGLNSKQLGEVIWAYSQKQWRTEAKKAHKVARRKRRSVRSASNRRHYLRRKEHRRQEWIDFIARLKEGVKGDCSDAVPSSRRNKDIDENTRVLIQATRHPVDQVEAGICRMTKRTTP
jgi:hypothetical protein